MKTNTLRVGFVQSKIFSKNPLDNKIYFLKLVQHLLKHKPKLIIFPEIVLGAPPSKKWRNYFVQEYKVFTKELQTLSNNNNVFFYGSIHEKKQNNFFNTAILVSPDTAIKRYQKIHLFRYEHEERVHSPGLHTKIFSTPWGKIAPLVCYDLRFPELMRKLVFKGATIALICAQWPQVREQHWKTLLKARAIENQIFVIACNRIGSKTINKKRLIYSGQSCVISPWGETLFKMGPKEETGIFEININDINKIRCSAPFLNDAIKNKFHFDL